MLNYLFDTMETHMVKRKHISVDVYEKKKKNFSIFIEITL